MAELHQQYRLEPGDIEKIFDHLENGSREGAIDRDQYSVEFYEDPSVIVEVNKARMEYKETEKFRRDLEKHTDFFE